MNNKSVFLLITSIAIFIFGIVTSIFTIMILNIDILDGLNSYPGLRFLIGFILILMIAFFFTLSFRAYRNHQEQKKDKDQYDMVKLDNLTQIYNFDYFVTQLQVAQTPFSLVMLDIDNFKEINDKFNPVIGDLVLKVIAKSIKDNIRINDIVARFQGDAFLIILQNCPPQNAMSLMKAIRTNIKENEKLSEKNIKLSTSVGIEFVSHKESTEELLRNAVDALCQAKTNSEDHKVILFDKKIQKKKILKIQ